MAIQYAWAETTEATGSQTGAADHPYKLLATAITQAGVNGTVYGKGAFYESVAPLAGQTFLQWAGGAPFYVTGGQTSPRTAAPTPTPTGL